MNDNAENCDHHTINNNDIVLTNNRLSRIAATSHDIRREDKRHQLECAGEDRFVRHPNRSGNIYDYFGNRYGIAFFIGERKDHYSNINNFIFRSIVHHRFGLQPIYTDELFVNLIFILPIPTESPYYNQARMHLAIDRRDVLARIDTLLTHAEQHRRGVDRLHEIFDITVKNAFLTPTPLGGYYNYNDDNVRYMATSLWNKCLKEHERDFIHSVRRSTNGIKVDIKVEMGHGIVRFNDLLIGEDGEGELRLIESSMKKILNNQRILKAILSLSSNRRDLDHTLNQIAGELAQISNTIDDGTYKTKAKCCPTLLRMLEDYAF